MRVGHRPTVQSLEPSTSVWTDREGVLVPEKDEGVISLISRNNKPVEFFNG